MRIKVQITSLSDLPIYNILNIPESGTYVTPVSKMEKYDHKYFAQYNALVVRDTSRLLFISVFIFFRRKIIDILKKWVGKVLCKSQMPKLYYKEKW